MLTSCGSFSPCFLFLLCKLQVGCVLSKAVCCQRQFSTGWRAQALHSCGGLESHLHRFLEIWPWALHCLLLNLSSNLWNEESRGRWDCVWGATSTAGPPVTARRRWLPSAALRLASVGPPAPKLLLHEVLPLLGAAHLILVSPSWWNMFPWLAITHLCFSFSSHGNGSIARERNMSHSSRSVRCARQGWVGDFEKDAINIAHWGLPWWHSG